MLLTKYSIKLSKFATQKATIMKQDKSSNCRSKVIRRILKLKLKDERIAKWSFIIASIYALISNFLYRCPPLNIDPTILNVMASVDDVIRNCCYGVMASISFYIFHDFIENHKAKVDLYNDMFEELDKLHCRVQWFIKSACNNQFDEKQDIEQTVKGIYSHLCINEKENFTGISTNKIPIHDFYHVQTEWSFIQSQKKKFLEAYGNDINRVEFFKLNSSEYDISNERLTNAMPEVETFEEGMTVTIRDYDILRASRLFVEFYLDLSKMVEKYSIYKYSKK